MSSSSGLGRRLSGRDKNKALPNLGPSSPQRAIAPQNEPRSYNLVVCGATQPTDGFIFSDFMGFCFALTQKGVGGDFMSCFPVDQHFAWLNKFHPKIKEIKEIKFGKVSNVATRGVIEYSRQQYERHEYFWNQIGPMQLKDEVIKWIEEKIKSTISGDVVNIIIEGHGDAKGRGLCLGPNRIFPQEMRDLTGKFRDGIQVNIITGACHSGAIADVISATGQKNRHIAAACAAEQVATAYKRSVSNRLRNSRFSQAFCQSLSRMKLPGVIQQHIVRLGEHETWMTAMCYRCISPNHADGYLSDSYTSYNEPNDITQLVEHMIFRDKIDVVYDPAITASRRRIEYPSINEAMLKVFRNCGPDKPYPYNNVKQEVQKLVKDEASKCDSNTPFQADSGLIEELVFQKACEPDFAQMLKTLYWRGRIQNAVLDTFTALCNRGFLELDCLQQPINFYNVSTPVSMLAWLISCFEGPHQEKSLSPPPFSYHNDQFDGPYIWLATMILRGSTDIKKLFETITLCQYLGGLNMVAFETWRKYSEITDFVINPNEMAAQSFGPGYFGFWLPHGIQAFGDEAAQKFRAHINRFNRIESVFRSFFELPMEELWLESEQEALFNRFPRSMPGWKKSGDWTTVFAGSANTGLDTPPSTISSP